MTNKKDLGIKLGSKDMIFWKEITDSKDIDIEQTEKVLRYYKWIRDKAGEEYKEAEDKNAH